MGLRVPGGLPNSYFSQCLVGRSIEISVIRFLPQPTLELPLRGLYLEGGLPDDRAGPFVYGNFISSLDGRIAVAPPGGELGVPDAIANPRDWRLFQELALQADVVISTGRYLREVVEGKAQDLLTVYDDPDLADLAGWRKERGLSLHPPLAIVSASLRFPIPETLTSGERTVVVLTGGDADPARVIEIEAAGWPVIVAGEGKRVDGRRLVDCLAELGYRRVFSSAGPQVLHMLASAGVLDRLFLTFAGRVLAGKDFSTFVEGSLLDPPSDLTLATLYWDPYGLDGSGQLFASFDRT